MEKYMKDFNGEEIFCLEYDKAKLVDMVTELQEKYNSLITDYRLSIEKRVKLEQKIDTAVEYIKENSKISLDDSVSIILFYRQLLEILKGSE